MADSELRGVVLTLNDATRRKVLSRALIPLKTAFGYMLIARSPRSFNRLGHISG